MNSGEHILLRNLKGWSKSDISVVISNEPKLTGNPDNVGEVKSGIAYQLRASYEMTREKRKTDFNGDKISVKKIEVSGSKLKIFARKTDYFTLWGLPYASIGLLEKSNEDFIANDKSDIPCGLYSACMFVTSDGKVVMGVSSSSHGFGSGRLSFGYEEQAEIEDSTPVETAVRGLREEYGVVVSGTCVKVFGMCKSLSIAYMSAVCAFKVDLIAEEIVSLRERAEDRDEKSCLLAVPIEDVCELCKDELTSKMVKKYVVDGKINKEVPLVHHIANASRWELTKEYLRGVVES